MVFVEGTPRTYTPNPRRRYGEACKHQKQRSDTGTALATPSLLLFFLYGPQSLSLVMIAVAGLFIFSSTPVGVVAAQELLPGKTGLVSGLVMGLAWGVGGLVLTPIGWLTDRFSLVSVLTGVAFLPLLAGGLTLLYHDSERKPVTDSVRGEDSDF